jgi:hypothetical protein
MSIPPPYILSVGLLIGCAVIFSLLFLLHICRDYGLYNQHRQLDERRQKFQKIEYNLNICQKVIVSQPILPPPPKPLVNPIPVKAVKFSPSLDVVTI